MSNILKTQANIALIINTLSVTQIQSDVNGFQGCNEDLGLHHPSAIV
jgi:hypothetical protein